ncbi:MAG: DUF357 domain-containing protein [Candidatus Micrarchaeota archaeon]
MCQVRDEEKRIKEDMVMFDENIVKAIGKTERENMIIDLATRYRKDAGYYLEKKDYVTSFGCINYAHGLLDALIKY